ncbi:MAG: DUF4372 domain-containing protein [Candidatus Hydrogenedentota bacterium]
MLRSASLFSQLLEQFPRHEFARLVKKHQAGGPGGWAGGVATDSHRWTRIKV